MMTLPPPPPGIEYELPPLSAPQLAVLEASERCVDAEGAIRSGKSSVAALKCRLRLLAEPGIHGLASRWKQQDVDGQLRGLWRSVGAWFPPSSPQPRWNAQEESYDFPNGPDPSQPYDGGSRLFMRIR